MIVAGSLIDPGGRCPAHARPHSVGLVAPGQTEVHDEPKSEVSVAGELLGQDLTTEFSVDET
jgi:hypothetical protein